MIDAAAMLQAAMLVADDNEVNVRLLEGMLRIAG
jgi:hypothetical protein